MTTPTITGLLKYTDLQMAAEAFLVDGNGILKTGIELKAALISGNDHASKFTETQATDFIANWEVAAQCPNTTTGFSGTLFRYIGATDTAKGLTNGELVMSFRSTEFVDDAARDNQATNAMEVKTLGWAFGQIGDMESWYADLKKPGGPLAAGQVFSVTGYSLGGHLATAFDLLRIEDGSFNTRISETYTFNGAGVGKIKTGTLGSVMAEFTDLRTNGSVAKFRDSNVLAAYQSLRSIINGGASLAEIAAAHNQAMALLNVAPGDPAHLYKIDEAKLLIQAIDRVELVLKEILRLPGLTADITALNLSHPADIASNQVDATKLDYQLAVLFAQQNTKPSADTWDAGKQGILGRVAGPFVIPRFYDVYGDTSPSVVSNSQLHYGKTTPVFIEDQPLVRGTFIGDAIAVSWISDDVKLLVGDYNYNDLGDTHSLVLLQDSLNVQNTLAQLDPKLTSAAASKILKAASDKTMSWSTGTQGKAEGDVLENIVNALADMMGLGWQGAARLKGSLDGNTWAMMDDVGGNSGRNTFYLRLKAVTDSAAYKDLMGKSTVGTFNASMDASTDFGAFLALNFLSPVVIQTTDPGAIAKLKQANPTLAQAWVADAQISPVQKEAGFGEFTENWYTDRTIMLRGLVQRNERNAEKAVGATNTDYYDLTSNTIIYQRANGIALNVQANKVVFGGTGNDAIQGTDNPLGDHLYGGAGIDTINAGKGDDYLQGDAGDDILNGEEGADTLLGGAGNDTLNGGAGNDILRGGAGNDTYKFTGTWGSDTIEDSQGIDKIEVNGVILQGGKKIAEGVWRNAAQGVTYSLVGTGAEQVLEIKLANNPNIIRVKLPQNSSLSPTALLGGLTSANINSPSAQGWPDGLFGLTMDDTVAVPAPGNPLTGDYAKATNAAGTDYLLDANGNYIGSGLQANASDILLGSGVADVIQGLGGSDALFGYGGDDVIEGGDGADILMGGLGADVLNGGAGQDIIYGSSNGSVLQPTDVHYVAPVATFPNVFGQGFSWVMDSPNRDAEGIMAWYLSDNVQRDTQANDQGNIIDGGAGDDLILAGTGGDVVHGGADSDEIFGMGGSDQLFGDDGADRIYGDGSVVATTLLSNTAADQHGNDVIDGGAGNDILIGQGGDDEVFGGADNDKLWGDDRNTADTPVAVHGNDYLDGGDGNDKLVGGGRDDTLFGGAGDDKLWGDSGAASVGDAGYFDAAYHGDDYLDGEEGNDYLQGEGGDDTLFGGSGNDILVGDDDQERLDGQYHGDDYLDGEEGSDQMYGGGGDDTLYGGANDDLMYGDGLGVAAEYEGDDELYGEAGDDYLYGNGGNDYLDGGAGRDFISGGDGADMLIGGDGRNALFGGDGDDVLVSSSGEDYLDGGDGNDVYLISTGGGQTLVDDALGTNTLEIDGGSTNINDYQLVVKNGQVLLIAGNAGSVQIGPNVDFTQTFVRIGGQAVSLQQIVLQGDPAGMLHAADVLVSGEMVATSLVTTAQSLLGSTRADVLDGGLADDILQGDDGSDVLHGGAGNDNLYGGDGADLIVGGAGDDVMFGGSFHGEADNEADVYLFNVGDGHDQINGAGSGAGVVPLDIVRFGAGITAGSIQVASGQGLLGSASADLMITYGAGDTVTLGQGAFNELAEIQFADGSVLTRAQIVAMLEAQAPTSSGKIEASDAGSTLVGSAGNDYLHGGMGNDVLIGGAGNDRLQGKSGANTYVFGAGSGLDRIEFDGFSMGGTETDFSTLQFTDVSWRDLSLAYDGWDLLITQPTGDTVRLVDYARGWPDLCNVIDRDGNETDIRFLLGRQLPAAPGSLADRRQQFVNLQYNQLSTALQRVFSNNGFDYNTNVVPDSVSQVGIQAIAGQTLQLGTFLVPVTSQTVTKRYVSEQVYNEVTTTTPAHDAYFLPVPYPKPGQWTHVEIPYGSEPVYRYNEWAQTLSVIGWRVPAAAAETITTWVPAGWRMTEVFTYSEFMFDDTATQAFVTGTTGDDLIVQAPSSLGYPPLFRGTIEAGDGNDVVVLGSGSNSIEPKGFSRFEDWIGISAAYAGGWYGMTHPDYYQHGLGAWIDLGAGDDTATGTDGNDFIIGGAGNDWMDGQAGADTYYIAYEAGSVDHISDLARPMGDGWNFGEGSDGGTQFVMPPNKDTVEFDSSVSVSRLSYSWTTTALADPNAPFASADTLQLYKDGELFLLIDYFDPFAADYLSKAGVEQFKFSNGQTLSLAGLLETIHPYDPSVPPPTGTGPLSSTVYNDTLTGTAGDDVLDGWLGNDLLQGDRGNDTYILNRGYGNDTIQDVDATDGNTDVAQFGPTIGADQLWFAQSGYDLQVSIIGTNDSFIVRDWYMGDRYHVEQFKTSDGKTLLDSQVQNLVQAMSVFSPPAAGQTTLSAGYANALNTVIAANWH